MQVEIEEGDHPHYRLLWKEIDSSRKPDVYTFSRVVFGKNSVTMQAQFGARENARGHQNVYPLAAVESTYMDDSIDSVKTVQDCIQLYKELGNLCGIADMDTRKRVSKCLEAVAATPESYRATEVPITVWQ